MYKGADLIRDVEFVIFDEVHYVNDAEVRPLMVTSALDNGSLARSRVGRSNNHAARARQPYSLVSHGTEHERIRRLGWVIYDQLNQYLCS